MINLTPNYIKALFQEYQTYFNKNLGQHYLIDTTKIDKIVKNLPSTSQIVEIGPGIGNITLHYYKSFSSVILIELDDIKVEILRNLLTTENKGVFPEWVKIFNKDILKDRVTEYLDITKDYQIIGALPYNISKSIIRSSFELFPVPIQCTYITQKEVAEKYIFNEKNSFLSISGAIFAKTEKLFNIKKESFFPSPKVESSVIKITEFKATSDNDIEERKAFTNFIKQGFRQPRKKLKNNLPLLQKESKTLTDLLEKRAENITLQEWTFLYNNKD